METSPTAPAAEPLAISIDQVPALIEHPSFTSLPFEQRQTVLENALTDSANQLHSDPGYGPEAYSQFSTFATDMRNKVASSHSAGEKIADAGRAAVGMAKGLGLSFVGLAGDATALTPEGNPRIPFSSTANIALEGTKKLASSVDTTLARALAPHEKNFDATLARFQSKIYTGDFPFDPAKLKPWLEEESRTLSKSQSTYYRDAERTGTGQLKPQEEADAYAIANGIQHPRNAALLAQYMHTRDPKVWAALRENLLETPAHAAANATQQQAAETAPARQIITAGLGEQNAEEAVRGAGDPINLAGLIAPYLRGLRAAEATGIAGKAINAAKGATEAAGLGAIGYTAEHPNATLSEHFDNAAHMVAGALGMHGAGALVGKVFKKAPKPTDPDHIGDTTEMVQPEALPSGLESSSLESSVSPETNASVNDRPAGVVTNPPSGEGSSPSTGTPLKTPDIQTADSRPEPPSGLESSSLESSSLESSSLESAVSPSTSPIPQSAIRKPQSSDPLDTHFTLAMGDVDAVLPRVEPPAPETPPSPATATTPTADTTAAPAPVGQGNGGSSPGPSTLNSQPSTGITPGRNYTVIRKPKNWADRTLAEAAKRTSVGLDPIVLAAHMAKGAELFARGLRSFSAWSGAMIRQTGNAIRPHLRHLWKSVNDWAATEIREGRKNLNMSLNPAQALAYVVKGADWLKGEPKDIAIRFNEAPKFTDLKRTLNDWVGSMQVTSLAVRNLMSEIEKRAPDPLKRAGITNWIQAKGDDVVLAAREAASSGRLKDGYKAARNLTPDEVSLAQKIRGYYDAAGQRAQAAGVLDSWLDDYVNQVWQAPISSKFTRKFAFANKRKFESFFDGEQAGLSPSTKDISKLLGLYITELNKTIMTRQMIGNLTKGAASDGRPLAAPVGGGLPTKPGSDITMVLPGSKTPVKFNGQMHETRDYDTRAGHPALAKWKFAATDPEGNPVVILGQLAIHPEAARYIKNALKSSEIKAWMREGGDSFFGHYSRQAVRAVDAIQSQMKASMMSLSPFHIVQEGTHAVGHKVNPFTNIPAVDPTNPAHVDAMKHGLMVAGDHHAMGQFMDGFAPTGAWIERIPGIGPWQKALSEFTFHHYIPGLKLKTYEHILERNTERFKAEVASGKMTADDVKYLSAKQTNGAYGHLNYKDMGRNPTFQHLLRLILLAPDFLEARAKFTGQAMQGLSSKVGREQLIAMATLAGVFYVGARVMNAALNNGDTKNDLDHLFAVQAGNRNYTMRSVPEDIYRLVHDWRAFTAGRVSPLIGTGVLEGIFGVNRRGEKVSGGEVIQDMLTNAIPLSAKMLPGIRNLTATQKNHPVSPWEQFLGAAGVQIGRHSPITKAQRAAHEFAAASGVENRGSYPVSKFQQLRYALEDQNWDKARVEVATLKAAGMTPDKMKTAFRASLYHLWTGSPQLDVQWKATLNPEQKALLQAAEQRQSDVWARFLKVFAQ